MTFLLYIIPDGSAFGIAAVLRLCPHAPGPLRRLTMNCIAPISGRPALLTLVGVFS